MIGLPGRSRAEEDAWVLALDDEDPEALSNAAEAAMDAGRPLLAARVVGLLDERFELEPGSALERAARAARLLVHDRLSAHEVQPFVDAFEDAWRSLVAERIARMRARAGLPGTLALGSALMRRHRMRQRR